MLDHDAPDSAAYSGVTPTPANPNSCIAWRWGTRPHPAATLRPSRSTRPRAACADRECPGYRGQRLGPDSTSRFRPIPSTSSQAPGNFLTLSGTPARQLPLYRRRRGLPLLLQRRQRAVDHQPEQLPAAGHRAGHGHRVRLPAVTSMYLTTNRSLSTLTASSPPLLPRARFCPSPSGTNGALQAQTGGTIPDDPTLSNPILLAGGIQGQVRSTWPTRGTTHHHGQPAERHCRLFHRPPATAYQLSFIAGDEPFGSGAGPQCLVEDPSDQFIYSADFI